MTYRVWFRGTAVAAVVAAAAPARAQLLASSPVHVGITAGATPPLTTLSNSVNAGWNAGVLVDVGFPLVPLGFRVDGEWHQLSSKSFGVGTKQRARIVSSTLDATYAVGAQPIVRPYVIAGLGFYDVKSDRIVSPAVVDAGADTLQSSSASQFRIGLNAGLGVRVQLAPLTLFLEGRWHTIFTRGETTQIFPISIGITI